MGRSRYKWTEAKIWQWVREGRGQGAGANYKPWLRVSDVPSKGFSHRIWGELTHRVHHLRKRRSGAVLNLDFEVV